MAKYCSFFITHLSAVSYTHLDVYKRQIYNHETSNCGFDLSISNRGSAWFPLDSVQTKAINFLLGSNLGADDCLLGANDLANGHNNKLVSTIL